MGFATPFAPLALALWGPLTLLLFARLAAPVAASISIVGAAILLPSGYAWNFTGLPAIDREVIAIVFVVLGCALSGKGRLALPRSGRAIELLAIGMVLGAVMTVLQNGSPVWAGDRSLPGMPMWSVASRSAVAVLTFWLPLHVGRSLFRSPEDLRKLLIVFAVAGIGYSLLALWEARMSPQLHGDLYGYVPHSFAQAKRSTFFGWGWRPMVFVGHGIALSRFMMVCLVASIALWRQNVVVFGYRLGPAVVWLFLVLFLCQSLASVVYALLALPFVALFHMRWNRMALTALLAITITYPALRAYDLFPTEEFVAAAYTVSEDRAASLGFRFRNEDLLLERARERFWFGWGGYGRERVWDERGRSETVSDGYWVIVMGQTGLVGFLCTFGMILLPATTALRTLRGRRPSGDTTTMLGVAWILVLSSVDLLPNGFPTSWMPFIGGAMLGAARGWERSTAPVASEPEAPVSLSSALFGSGGGRGAQGAREPIGAPGDPVARNRRRGDGPRY